MRLPALARPAASGCDPRAANRSTACVIVQRSPPGLSRREHDSRLETLQPAPRLRRVYPGGTTTGRLEVVAPPGQARRRRGRAPATELEPANRRTAGTSPAETSASAAKSCTVIWVALCLRIVGTPGAMLPSPPYSRERRWGTGPCSDTPHAMRIDHLMNKPRIADCCCFSNRPRSEWFTVLMVASVVPLSHCEG